MRNLISEGMKNVLSEENKPILSNEEKINKAKKQIASAITELRVLFKHWIFDDARTVVTDDVVCFIAVPKSVNQTFRLSLLSDLTLWKMFDRKNAKVVLVAEPTLKDLYFEIEVYLQ